MNEHKFRVYLLFTIPWEFIIIKDQDLKEKLIEMRAQIPRQKEALSTAPVIHV